MMAITCQWGLPVYTQFRECSAPRLPDHRYLTPSSVCKLLDVCNQYEGESLGTVNSVVWHNKQTYARHVCWRALWFCLHQPLLIELRQNSFHYPTRDLWWFKLVEQVIITSKQHECRKTQWWNICLLMCSYSLNLDRMPPYSPTMVCLCNNFVVKW